MNMMQSPVSALLLIQAGLSLIGAVWAAQSDNAWGVVLSVCGLAVTAALGSVSTRQFRTWSDKLSDAETRAERDPLTGLLNRRGMQLRIESALASGRNDLALIILDVDRFKAINDRLGHGAGDAALVRVAQGLRGATRGQDCAARWGGDEFIVLLQGVTAPSAAASLCRRLESTTIEVSALARVQVTAGYAIARANDRAADLIARADEKLCRKKLNGKTRDEAKTVGAMLELGAHVKP